MTEGKQPTSTLHNLAEGFSTTGAMVSCAPVVGGVGQVVLGGGAAVLKGLDGDFSGAALEAGATALQAGLSEVSGGISSDVILAGKGAKALSGAGKLVKAL